MLSVIDKIALDDLDNNSSLFSKFVSSLDKGIPSFLDGVGGGKAFWLAKRDAVLKNMVSRDDERWERLVQEMEKESKRFGASDALMKKLGLARSRDAFFVVTGQQPGVLGGPLLTFYKVATTIALAAKLEQWLEHPCIPLYWCGADDSDFHEIRHLDLLTTAGSPIRVSIPREAHSAGMPVGDISATSVRHVWANVQNFVDRFTHWDLTERVVDDALANARDHGELTSAILVTLFGGNLAVVDGRSASVRRYAKSVIERYVSEEEQIKNDIVEQGARLESAGYHAQLNVGADSGVFLVEDGRRKNVTSENRSQLLDAIQTAVENCSPGVVLRNLVQDYTFSPLAAVLGPAEIAYRAQIAPLYERFAVEKPVAIPRMAATYVPPPISDLLQTDTPSMTLLLRNPAEFARGVYKSSLPDGLADASTALREDVHTAVDRFLGRIEKQLPKKSRGRIDSRLGDVRQRVENAVDAAMDTGKSAAQEKWPFLSQLDQTIRPLGKLQERYLSGLMPFLVTGEAAGDSLVELASQHIDDLLDGSVNHVVYSSR